MAADVAIKRAHLWLSLLIALVVLVGGLIGGIYGIGDPRWAGKEALAQVAAAAREDREATRREAAAAREQMRAQVQANREATLLIKQALDGQTKALEALLRRLDARDSRPLAPAPRRKRSP